MLRGAQTRQRRSRQQHSELYAPVRRAARLPAQEARRRLHRRRVMLERVGVAALHAVSVVAVQRERRSSQRAQQRNHVQVWQRALRALHAQLQRIKALRRRVQHERGGEQAATQKGGGQRRRARQRRAVRLVIVRQPRLRRRVRAADAAGICRQEQHVARQPGHVGQVTRQREADDQTQRAVGAQRRHQHQRLLAVATLRAHGGNHVHAASPLAGGASPARRNSERVLLGAQPIGAQLVEEPGANRPGGRQPREPRRCSDGAPACTHPCASLPALNAAAAAAAAASSAATASPAWL